MRCQGHTEPAGLAKGPFPIQGSLEVKVSSRMGGQISRSEHVTELTPLVCFAFPSAPSPRPFGDTSPMAGKGLGGYGGRSCCRRMRLESGTPSVWSGLSPGSQRARGGRERRRTCPA